MKRVRMTICWIIVAIVIACNMTAQADVFGTGDSQFAMDFVTISGETNPTSGRGIVNYDYRIGVYEVTNKQWEKFKANLGVPVTGNPSSAYTSESYWTSENVPVNNVSWYEAAQFVNWLNTINEYQPAYNFTGTQGTSNYTFTVWDETEAAIGTNLFRHKDAFYFLPTEDEWVKAAYWNGAETQTYATKAGETVHQGDGLSGTGWNYRYDGQWATDPRGPWEVGSGSEELNGTYDMMGNVWEWDETLMGNNYRGMRGSSYHIDDMRALQSSPRYFNGYPTHESLDIGFRVASVPEPCTLLLLGLGGLILRRKQRQRGQK